MAWNSRSKDTFRIVLDGPMRDVYSAGDHITGRICFSSPSDRAVGRVVVRLWGRTKTKLYRRNSQGGRMVFRGRGILFSRDLVLYNGAYKHKEPNFEWPFDLVFPDVAEETSYGDKWENLSDGRFLNSTDVPGIDLPSTMKTKGTVMALAHTFDCWVQYKVEATMTEPGSSKPAYQDELHLHFSQSVQPDSKPGLSESVVVKNHFMLKSYRLAHESAGQALSLKQKAKMALGSESVPSSTIGVDLKAPLSARLGERLVVSLKLTYLDPNTGKEHPEFVAPVYLKSLKASITATTAARSRKRLWRCYSNNNNRTLSCDVGLQSNQGLWNEPFSEELGNKKELELDDINTLGLTPSFRTANISQQYTLKFQFVYECVGKEFTMKKETSLEILPCYRGQIVPAATTLLRRASTSASSEMADSILEEPDEQLPAYEEVPGNLTSEEGASSAPIPEKSRLVEY